MFNDLFTNKVLLIPICAWALAQLMKFIIALLSGKGFDLDYLFGPGGMPSSHSAMVSALAISVGIVDGFGSSLFAVSVVLAVIVIYDSAGVRQSVGQQSVILNRIVRELRLRQTRVILEKELRELIGHTPIQVIVGVLFGISFACLWLYLANL
jgi:acid phosphatase family membrane protein YuiD